MGSEGQQGHRTNVLGLFIWFPVDKLLCLYCLLKPSLRENDPLSLQERIWSIPSFQGPLPSVSWMSPRLPPANPRPSPSQLSTPAPSRSFPQPAPPDSGHHPQPGVPLGPLHPDDPALDTHVIQIPLIWNSQKFHLRRAELYCGLCFTKKGFHKTNEY